MVIKVPRGLKINSLSKEKQIQIEKTRNGDHQQKTKRFYSVVVVVAFLLETSKIVVVILCASNKDRALKHTKATWQPVASHKTESKRIIT